MKFCDLNQEDAARLTEESIIALLPVGAMEVHGDHLPLGTDWYLADAVSSKVEQSIGAEHCIILPCIPYGQVWSLKDAPGSINIPDTVLSAYLAEIVRSLNKMKIKKLAIINAHMGNVNAIKAMTRALKEECSMKIYSFTYPGASSVIQQVCTSERPHHVYFHACEIETSYMLYLCPDQVDMSKAISQYPKFPDHFEYTQIPWTDFMKKAVLGDATAATIQKGQRIIDEVVRQITQILS